MRAKMSRKQRQNANFLLRAIKDYGIPDFDVHGLNVKEFAHGSDTHGVVSYLVTVGDNVVSIEYYYSDGQERSAYVYLNGYSLCHCEVACIGDMVYVVVPFARMVQHLN